MPPQTSRAAAQRPPKPAKTPKSATAAAAVDLGILPEWNLADLYPAIEAPEIKRDLERARGRMHCLREGLQGPARGTRGGLEWPVTRWPKPVRRYEALEDLIGRLISYASLVYSGNTTDPIHAKFYGDVQERITSISLHLLFFTLELNRIDDAVLERAMADPALGHYRPWIEDVRKEKPYQLEDRIEQLFHEKSVSGYAAWNRLFDETIAGLRFNVDGKELAIEPTLNFLQDQ